MSLIDSLIFLIFILSVIAIVAVALYYDYKLRFNRTQKINRLLEALERYISLHNK